MRLLERFSPRSNPVAPITSRRCEAPTLGDRFRGVERNPTLPRLRNLRSLMARFRAGGLIGRTHSGRRSPDRSDALTLPDPHEERVLARYHPEPPAYGIAALNDERKADQ